MPYPNDNSYEELTITDVNLEYSPTHWSIETSAGWFCIPKSENITPQVGHTVRFYDQAYSHVTPRVRGVYIEGEEIYYTSTEDWDANAQKAIDVLAPTLPEGTARLAQDLIDNPPEGNYAWQPEMGYITGKSGVDETTCQTILTTVLQWLDQSENLELNLRLRDCDSVRAIAPPDLSSLKTQILAANAGLGGVLQQTIFAQLIYIKKKGWNPYVQERKQWVATRGSA